MPNQRLFHFFCTRRDLLLIGKALDHDNGGFTYCRTGPYSGRPFDAYGSIGELPNLGVAQHQNAIANESYLVLRRDRDINYKQLVNKTFVVDQEENVDSIIFQPSGLFKNSILLCGRAGTIHYNSPPSVELYKIFLANFKKHCRKFSTYYVGDEAAELCKKGLRLTISAQSPPAFDLTLL